MIDTDHFPLVFTIKTRFAKLPPKDYQPKLQPTLKTTADYKYYNELISDSLAEGAVTKDTLHTAILQANQECFLPKPQQQKRDYISARTWKQIELKNHFVRLGDRDQVRRLKRIITKSARNDRNAYYRTLTDSIDIRNKWMGIKQMKSTYSPKPYEKQSSRGERLPFAHQAEAVATHLANDVWSIQHNDPPPSPRENRINQHPPSYSTDPITLQELHSYLHHNAKKGRAPGVSGVPMDSLIFFNTENLNKVLQLLNQWWEQEALPQDLLLARVVSIFKS